jgi:hypothetical protein
MFIVQSPSRIASASASVTLQCFTKASASFSIAGNYGDGVDGARTGIWLA